MVNVCKIINDFHDFCDALAIPFCIPWSFRAGTSCRSIHKICNRVACISSPPVLKIPKEGTIKVYFMLNNNTQHTVITIFCNGDSVQLNHPYGTFSKFPEQAKEK